MPKIVEDRICYGCLFCKVGSEQRIIEDILKINTNIEAIAPVKLRYHRGRQRDEMDRLFPGYIFVRADADFDLFQEIKHPNLYRVLCDAERNWRLHGPDAKIAEAMFQNGGIIGYSKAYYENERIRILEGFLKNYEGNIIRVNRRMRTAEVVLTFCNKETRIWVGFEEIENINSYI